MRQYRILAAICALLLAAAGFYRYRESVTTRYTDIEVKALDSHARAIGIGSGTFFDKDGTVLKSVYYTSVNGWGNRSGRFVNDAWGKKAKRVKVEAFSCQGEGPVDIARKRYGSMIPNPAGGGTISVHYLVQGDIVCRPLAMAAAEKARRLEGLIDYLRHENLPFRIGALKELQRLGSEAAAAENPLLEFIRRHAGRQAPGVYDALVALGAIGANSPAAVAMLESILTDSDLATFHKPAVRALETMGPQTQGVLPALIASLAFDKEYTALGVFSQWGARAGEAVPAIVQVIQKEQTISVRSSALYTLYKIGTERALEARRRYEPLLQSPGYPEKLPLDPGAKP